MKLIDKKRHKGGLFSAGPEAFQFDKKTYYSHQRWLRVRLLEFPNSIQAWMINKQRGRVTLELTNYSNLAMEIIQLSNESNHTYKPVSESIILPSYRNRTEYHEPLVKRFNFEKVNNSVSDESVQAGDWTVDYRLLGSEVVHQTDVFYGSNTKNILLQMLYYTNKAMWPSSPSLSQTRKSELPQSAQVIGR